ncbi:DEAD/DEAH box helicase family protein [Novipirellula sp. SH528]|uniref:DEAD/DEAH box helicase family protein n=1 Tax=Novipirellula sp. SH528 TaxID=3454466 RepID=UPI003FA135F5
MADLKEFQQAAVDRIVRMLHENGSGRFLLADEVGLGKTLIARGVIENLSRKKKSFTVVYLCSNLEIASQNAEKLVSAESASRPLKERLTLMTLAMERSRTSALRIYSFTPGTSLNLGQATGVIRERKLLLLLLSRQFDFRLSKRLRSLFCCSADPDRWMEETDKRSLNFEFGSDIKAGFARRWAALVRKTFVDVIDAEKTPTRMRLDSAVVTTAQDFARFGKQDWTKRNRSRVISELRTCLALASLDHLNPDLVVMDEFQRFRDVLINSRNESSVESKLLSMNGAKVLILSATPYKMYTMGHEDEDHHQDFLETYAFLKKCDTRDSRVGSLKANLENFRTKLESISQIETVDEDLLQKKHAIETDLCTVMCRTERNRYLDDSKKGINEIPVDGIDLAGQFPQGEELGQYLELRRFMLQESGLAGEYARSIEDFWKSGPSLLSFMDGHYSLISKLRARDDKLGGVVPKHLLLPEASLRKSATSNLKFRQLFKKVFGDDDQAKDDWPFLWIKPRFTYYRDRFYGKRKPSKFLIFSHWHFVPKTIAYLASAESERRIRFDRDRSTSSPLSFKSGSLSLFNVCFPSLALAGGIDLLRCSARHDAEPDQSAVERAAREELLKLLPEGVAYRKSGKASDIWQVIAAIESNYAAVIGNEFSGALSRLIADRDLNPSVTKEDGVDWFSQCQDKYAQWFRQSLHTNNSRLVVTEKSLGRILRIALYSPTISLLRSFLRVADEVLTTNTKTNTKETVIDLFAMVGSICLSQVRNYFNRPLVQSIVDRHGRGGSYVDKVLDYCARGHLQAVLDEFVYLEMGNVSGNKNKSRAEKLAEQVGTAFSMNTGTPRLNMPDSKGRFQTNSPIVGATHFALSFGEDTSVEREGGIDRKSRKSDVRTAFNSPFWPFVLATTSVGQEGLDFHWYCKDIVHWNLPSNPVDLEQREGRINRHNSLAIRDMIARDYPLRELKTFASQRAELEPSGLPWEWVFDAIKEEPMNDQTFKHGLFPHWIYKPKDENTEILRRHLIFYNASRDIHQYRRLKRDLTIYRLVFGQPRQEDIVKRIRENIGDDIEQDSLEKLLPIYMINLSPFVGDAAWNSALKQAERILGDDRLKSDFISMVRKFYSKKSAKLLEASDEIQSLLQLCEGSLRTDTETANAIQAAAALFYLVNPYDEVFDFFPGVGFADDIKRIKQVHSEVFGIL